LILLQHWLRQQHFVNENTLTIIENEAQYEQSDLKRIWRKKKMQKEKKIIQELGRLCASFCPAKETTVFMRTPRKVLRFRLRNPFIMKTGHLKTVRWDIGMATSV